MNQAELNQREIDQAVQHQWEDDMYEVWAYNEMIKDDDDDDDDRNIDKLEEKLQETKEQLEAIKFTLLCPSDECPPSHIINLRAQIERRDRVIEETEQTMAELRNDIEKIKNKLDKVPFRHIYS